MHGRRFVSLAFCEVAIFAFGCWVGVVYPNPPHWVWLVVIGASLLLAFIIWPRGVTQTKDVTDTTKKGLWYRLVTGVFHEEALDTMGIILALMLPLVLIVFLFAALDVFVDYLKGG